MKYPTKDQQGFAHVIVICAAVTLIGIAGIGYVVYRNNQKTTTSDSSEKKTATTESDKQASLPKSRSTPLATSDAQEIYDFIGKSINNINSTAQFTQSKIITDQVTYATYLYSNPEDRPKALSRTDYFPTLAITTEENDKALENIKNALSNRTGTVILKSGTEPGTYSKHTYLVATVTLSDDTTVSLEISTEHNDAGHFIIALLY